MLLSAKTGVDVSFVGAEWVIFDSWQGTDAFRGGFRTVCEFAMSPVDLRAASGVRWRKLFSSIFW